MLEPPGDGDDQGAKLVLETGIALVHEGEVVLPAAGSQAQAVVMADDARTVIHYHFPVEIEIRAEASSLDLAEISRHVYERLTKRLREGR